MTSAAGESDLVGAFSKEGLSSINVRQQLIFPTDEREKFKLQDKNPKKRPGSDADGEGSGMAVQELEADAASPSKKQKKQKVYFNSEKAMRTMPSKWALTCVAFSKEAGVLADNMDASLAHVQQIKK